MNRGNPAGKDALFMCLSLDTNLLYSILNAIIKMHTEKFGHSGCLSEKVSFFNS